MKKKILFIHATLDVGGAEMMRFVLLRNIDRERYDIKICCIGKKGNIGKEFEKLGYAVDELEKNPDSLNILITLKLARYIKKEQPHILHSSLFNANFHARLGNLFCRIPHVITEEHGEHKQYKGVKFLPYKIADFLLAGLTDFIICCSERLRQDISRSECLSFCKIVNIENCIDRGMYQVKAGREEIRKKHGIKGELVLILAASLKAGKGHDYFIDALKTIKDEGHNFKCFFAGDGPLRSALYRKCSDIGLSENIIFLGNIDNIADYLNASDMFVLPSFSEGLSVALMEAMTIGLCVIATDVGSNSDLVKTGFNGTLVLPGDANGLENALRYYLGNRQLIKSFGENSKSIIEAKYSSVDRYVRQYYELWDKCANNQK